MKAIITTDAEFSAALDYLPVAVRAAERNPGNDTLWTEAVRAQRAVIDYADAHLPEALAAGVQATIGAIAQRAVLRDDLAIATGAYGGESMAVRSERSKAHIRSLIANH